jgi:hypothetical protein
MPKPLDHDDAVNVLCDCAATVTVLSYQEAIEGYLTLRGLTIAKVDALAAKVERLRHAQTVD